MVRNPQRSRETRKYFCTRHSESSQTRYAATVRGVAARSVGRHAVRARLEWTRLLGDEGPEGRRPHPRPSAFQQPKRLGAREADFGSKSSRSRVRRRRSEFPASREFFSARSALRSRKPCNVMALLALQPTACRSDRARNREFPTTGTGNYQALSQRNRERTGGRKRGAAPGAAGLQGAAGIPSPAGEGRPREGSMRARRAARAKSILLSSIDTLKLHAGGPASRVRNAGTQSAEYDFELGNASQWQNRRHERGTPFRSDLVQKGIARAVREIPTARLGVERPTRRRQAGACGVKPIPDCRGAR